MKRIKPYLKYVFLFVYFFLGLIFFFNISRGDTYVNFGFSYAIARGEIPYVDFNMVIPPFAPWLYSIFLLFSKSIIMFYLGQAFLLTIFFYFLFQLLNKKAWIYLVLLSIPFPIVMISILFPGYNFLLLFLFVLLIYCEKKSKSDFVIGILLGLAFMTKQTVGGLLILPTIYYLFVDYRKFFKRVGGFLFPVLLICGILLVTGSFLEFVDLCFLGLLDFGNSNLYIGSFHFVVYLLCLVILMVRIIKKPKNIENYYLLLFSSCILPIIDYYHVALFLGAFFVVTLLDGTLKRDVSKYCFCLALSFGLIWFVVQSIYIADFKMVHFPNFEFSLTSSKYRDVVTELDQYIESQDKNIVFFLRGSENYFYKIKHNLDITYFDLPNYGNYGYNGTDKLIQRIKSLKKNTLIIIDYECYLDKSPTQQYVTEAVTYIMDRGHLVKKIGNYQIYEL